MISEQVLKQTPLYSVHTALGARMAPFAGWDLPLYYNSILKEHQAVREAAGLFDVSHLGHLEVSGPKAAVSLEPLITRHLQRLESGQAFYTPMLNEQGSILDEMIVYHLEPGRFRWVVNAANGDKVLAWMKRRLPASVSLSDLRQAVGTLALQGPRAVEVLRSVSDGSFERLGRYRVGSGAVAGRPAWVARTGYTGEDGFELFLAAQDLETVWNRLLEAGRPFGIRPVGLGARDTLRLEAGLPLGGSDLDEETTPLEAGLEWTVDWEKGPFIGREVLERQRRDGVGRRLAGFVMKGGGVPRHGYSILRQGERVGQVTSGTCLSDGRSIGLGYLVPPCAAPGTEIAVEIHSRQVPAVVVRIPFYRRKR